MTRSRTSCRIRACPTRVWAAASLTFIAAGSIPISRWMRRIKRFFTASVMPTWAATQSMRSRKRSGVVRRAYFFRESAELLLSAEIVATLPKEWLMAYSGCQSCKRSATRSENSNILVAPRLLRPWEGASKAYTSNPAPRRKGSKEMKLPARPSQPCTRTRRLPGPGQW